MANPTSNFGWQMPTPTDLVTDLPADFEVFGQAVDTSMADLKGGTSGQILAKNSNTDMDFVWIANDQGDITGITASSPLTGGGTSGAVTIGIQDGTTAQKGAVQLENSTSSTSTTTAAVPASVKSAFDLANAAIPKSVVDAAGDLLVGTANDTVGRIAIGTNGQVLTSNGTTAGWAAVSAGGMTLISTTTLSGASITLSSIPGTYTNLQLFIENFTNSTADGVLRIAPNGGTDYAYANTIAAGTVGQYSATYVRTITNQQRTNDASSLQVTFYNYAMDDFIPFTLDGGVGVSGGYSPQTATGYTYTANAAGITSLVISNSGGNWAGGIVYLYGVK